MNEPNDLATLLAAFEQGRAEARDPTNAQSVRGGPAVTSPKCSWRAQVCPGCGHTFRTGDPVFRADDGSVFHRGRGLACMPDAPARPLDLEEIAGFYAGLDAALPPPEGMVITLLSASHFLTAPPLQQYGRRRCQICAHTFRPGDRVIVCPCRPEAPICQAAIHRDPVNGLFCWEAWSPGGTNDCPVTSRKSE